MDANHPGRTQGYVGLIQAPPVNESGDRYSLEVF